MKRDKISLKRMQFYGYHGLFDAENTLGQRFFVDADIYTSLKLAGKSDNMNDSIDYGKVFHIIEEIVEGEPKNLIEAVAEEIAETLLLTFAQIDACRIEVTKPDPPIPGHYDSVSVQVFRERR